MRSKGSASELCSASVEKYARPVDFAVLLVAIAATAFLFRELYVGAIPDRWTHIVAPLMALAAVSAVFLRQRRRR